MSSEKRDEARLTGYLLGSLPEDEAERFDELSVADEDFAWRLRIAENDLVDAYVRGELSGETLERFETHYLSSAKRREKVRFAGALRLLEDRLAASPEGAAPATRLAGSGSKERPPRHFPAPRLTAAMRLAPAGLLAAAALLLLVPAGYLFFANLRLRRELTRVQTQRASLESRARDLQKGLERPPVEVPALRQPEGAVASREPIAKLQVLSFVLLPQTRGPGRVETVSVPPGTDAVSLQLQLESDEFPRYRVALRTAASDRPVWRSGSVRSARAGDGRAVTITVPAALLTPRHFSAELTGLRAAGGAEPVGSYAFRVVLR